MVTTISTGESNLEKLDGLVRDLGLPEESYINMAVDVRKEQEVTGASPDRPRR